MMDKKEIIQKIIDKIISQYQPEKIILFGSYAWGKPTKDSDVDLFILKKTDQKHRQRMLTVRRILSEENALVGLDILVYSPEEVTERLKMGDAFIAKILRRGNIVYG